ncbi:MAG: hypothetical protein ABSE99_03935 [Terracidiphilus sp.]
MILLAVANLAILGMRLWPWPEVFTLPGNGTTGFDPAISLVAYVGLILWMNHTHYEGTRWALSVGTVIGLLAGCLLVAYVALEAISPGQSGSVQAGLLVTAGILWGFAGFRGARLSGNTGLGALSGAWSAMVSCLMACAAILVSMFFAAPRPVTQDPWKQYEGLAIGNQATQALVHSLNSVTGFLLIGPLVGAVAGLLFAYLLRSKKA